VFVGAQVNRFDFDQVNNVRVIENGDSLINAWAGGMNFMQFLSIDLNSDSEEDLLAFDRTGNRLMPFVVKTNSGSKRYKYAPEFIDSFPEITNWIILEDYDCDGFKDLFTSVNGNIGVYKNDGNLKFTWALTTNNLESTYPYKNYKENLLVYREDYPEILDVDNDGDLDIFTFGQGNTVQHHEGQQSCGLDFKVKYNCWGGFKDSGISNKLSLDACSGNKKDPGVSSIEKTQHSGGAAILLLDLKGNGLKDAIIGDASFNHVSALFNDGQLDSAHMYDQDTLFPYYDTPINQFVYPGFYYEDVDFDGVKDLIVSPSTKGSENVNNTWFYKDKSLNNTPVFELNDSSFLQGQMPDFGEGAYPILSDMNFDLKPDLFAANFGVFQSEGVYKSSVSYYKNTGTSSSPEFSLVTKDFANLSTYNLGNALYPAFTDLDNDIDLDMMVGTADGVLHYFENDYSTGVPVYTLKTLNYGGIDVGNFSTPVFFDIDGDGDVDLFIGNSSGTIVYYKNTGTSQSPNFVHVTDAFGSINVQGIYSSLGYSVPFFIKDNGTINLFVGSYDKGVIQYDSLQSVMALPKTIHADFDSGNKPSTGDTTSILGLTKKAGRNQILFRANELKAKGLVYGYINQLSFNILNSDLPKVAHDGLTISLKNVNRSSMNSFVDNTQWAYFLITTLSQGWLDIALQTPFLWDGKSDLVVEFCFENQSYNYKDAIMECEDVGFSANAFGDGDGSKIGTDGCSLPFAGSSNLRPNIRFDLTPAFVETDQVIFDGERNAASFADFNNDGFLDAIAGNYSGGLTLYQGKMFNNIGLDEDLISLPGFKGYPNPVNNYLTLQWDETIKDELDIVVTDISGRSLVNQTIVNGQELDLTSLPNGLYIVNAINKNVAIAQIKVVIIHD